MTAPQTTNRDEKLSAELQSNPGVRFSPPGFWNGTAWVPKWNGNRPAFLMNSADVLARNDQRCWLLDPDGSPLNDEEIRFDNITLTDEPTGPAETRMAAPFSWDLAAYVAPADQPTGHTSEHGDTLTMAGGRVVDTPNAGALGIQAAATAAAAGAAPVTVETITATPPRLITLDHGATVTLVPPGDATKVTFGGASEPTHVAVPIAQASWIHRELAAVAGIPEDVWHAIEHLFGKKAA
jgi:hypothetical protein